MARPSDPHARIDLLRAAEAVFEESGLERAKVEDITARAGRSKGSFYLHFESKDDAFRQIVEAMIVRLADILEEVTVDAGGATDAPALLRRWLEADLRIFEYLWENRGVARLLFQGGCSASFGYLINEFAERARARIETALAQSVSAGFYRADLDVGLASMVIAGAYDRLGRELVHLVEKPDLRAWLSRVQQLFLRGLASDRLAAALHNDPPVREPDRAGVVGHHELDQARGQSPRPVPPSGRRGRPVGKGKKRWTSGR